ncbi:MAG: TonB-dependent receptor [Acidobacteria bacterium]|nr:TonB-dependent receptor [Acidobacteriota bacterium]
MRLLKHFSLLLGIAALSVSGVFAQATGSIEGQVTDALGAVVVGASITIVSKDGRERRVITNARGEYALTGLAPGIYTVKAIAPKFALYENAEVEVAAGQKNELIVVLMVAGVEETVDISNDVGVSTDPDSSGGATVIKGKDLEALPDDPDELEAALQALAGPSAGPAGGQIFIDGFTGGRIPPRDAIREIRINQNPFSAEFDRLGFGRLEILTRPGSDKWRGSASFNFNDARLNSRNPFASNRAPSQTKTFGGNLSGPVQKGRSSFFLDVNQRMVDNNTIINALVLDPSLNIVSFNQDVQVPTRRFNIGPRFDYQINDRNTLVVRYNFGRSTSENQGIGDTSLPSRAFASTSREHEIRITETMIINPKTVNETRFEFSDSRREQTGDNSIPTVNVPAAFTGGGSQIGQSFNRSRVFEVNNFTTTSFGKNNQHSVKFGGRIRNVNISDRSENNYGGSFVFPGFFGADACDINSDGIVSSLEQYRCKVSGAVGVQYNPTQFSITTGNPLATVTRTDYGLFITDDWRISPALMLSFGLRYENQTNISSNTNFAPRFGFAWSPGAGGARAPKTVIRGGAGFFYERFSENLTLQAIRFDGQSQLNLLVSANDTDPVRRAAALALLAQPVFTLNGVTNVPTAAQILAVLPQSNTIRRVADDLSSPYTMQAAIGVERQLPYNTVLSSFFITSKTNNVLRSRNINAPICPLQIACLNAPRPDPTGGNVYQYESTGESKQNQLILNFRTNISNKYSLFGNYRLGFAEGDSDGAFSFPAYSYDLTGEYGRSSFDIRHNFTLGGNLSLPWGFNLNPFIIASSGRPFNITRGIDANGDGLFTERPTFGELALRCNELSLNKSFCDIGSNDPGKIIPRNYGLGPAFFNMNMRVSRTFGFGTSAAERVASTGGQTGGPGGGIPGMGRGGMGGGRMGGGGGGFFGGGGDTRKPYNLNVSVNFSNILNKVNLGTPVGSLSSSRFGQSTSTAGGFGGFGGFGGGGAANRRIELQMRFSW